MSNFVISDLHFYDDNIIKYDRLPFDNAIQMNEKIIKNWNKEVHNTDTVYVLGDVFFCSKENAANILSRLHGRKILVMGNHDEKSIKWYMDVGFNEVYKSTIIVNDFIHMSHMPPMYVNKYSPDVHFYGHVHNSKMYPTITLNTACVCASRWNFTPINIPKLLLAMKYAESLEDEYNNKIQEIIKQVI